MGDQENDTPKRVGSDFDATTRVVRLERNAAGQLVVHLTDGNGPIMDVRLVRYFPWSISNAYVSILGDDGREITMLKSLDELDQASRKVAESELRDKVFNPKILRILSYKHEFGITSITAETDRGQVIFQFRGRHNIRLLSRTRALFRDVDGNIYELTDFNCLDPVSQRYLQRYF